ncbi:hypothetical protein K440DRAFT_235379 [Wilcoxina mikolae CBS 423.85]|nr:hypothetical protein K440DRAFT_235379 [Wilcoxina mikolae CBS 423.85]
MNLSLFNSSGDEQLIFSLVLSVFYSIVLQYKSTGTNRHLMFDTCSIDDTCTLYCTVSFGPAWRLGYKGKISTCLCSCSSNTQLREAPGSRSRTESHAAAARHNIQTPHHPLMTRPTT